MEEMWRTGGGAEGEGVDDGDGDDRLVVRPNADSYEHAVRAWGNSPRPDKVEMAMDALRRAEDEYCSGRNEAAHPTLGMYHAAVSACANVRRGDSADSRARALQSAVGAVQAMKKDSDGHGRALAANSETFRLLLGCYARLLPKDSAERERAVRWRRTTCTGRR